jgi:hypothetical protein
MAAFSDVMLPVDFSSAAFSREAAPMDIALAYYVLWAVTFLTAAMPVAFSLAAVSTVAAFSTLVAALSCSAFATVVVATAILSWTAIVTGVVAMRPSR